VQVLYRTTGEQGQPTVTVTTIIKPLISFIGTKIVAYQTAYDALGSECDPSYTLQGGNPSDSTAQEEELAMAAYLLAGFIVTVPDYEGTNLDWGAGQESGYGTLDAIRATESYLGASSSTKVGMVGYSGGAIATEWAAELAPSYAPGLHIIGAAADGVPVDFAHNLTYINGDDDWSGVIPAVLVSLGRAFGVNITQYLSSYGEELTSQVSSECIATFASAYPGLTIQQLLLPQYSNPFDVPALVTILNHLIMGTSGGTPAEPLLLGVGDSDGTGDGIMIDGDVQALAHEYCQRGVPVTFTVYPGLPHSDAAVPFEAQALAFLEGRFNGAAAPNGCASIGQGNSLAPLPQPAS
jgi:pimeloyl-ACP methyl ester carboxylesterase